MSPDHDVLRPKDGIAPFEQPDDIFSRPADLDDFGRKRHPDRERDSQRLAGEPAPGGPEQAEPVNPD